jgi:hypothetical protein
MKRHLLVIVLAFLCVRVSAQSTTTATITYVLGMGLEDGCVATYSNGKVSYTSTGQVKYGFQQMLYNYFADSLINQSSTPCQPVFPKYANDNNQDGSGVTQVYNSSIAYDPVNQWEYFFAAEDTTVGGTTLSNTYIYGWPVGSCPNATNVMFITEVKYEYVLSTFDNNGQLWAVSPVTVGGKNELALQTITLSGSTATLGALNTIVLTSNSPTNYIPGSGFNGDFVFTPQGNMFVVDNNYEIAIQYQNYNSSSTSNTVVGQYVGTVTPASGQDLVGLAYGGGSFIGSINSSATCTPTYDQINMLTAGTTAMKYGGSYQFQSMDLASVTSGIGAAKSLVSLTYTGTSGQYTAVYDVYIQDYGNYPTSNVQVVDNLTQVNGPTNLSNVSLAWAGGVSPPASDNIALNPSFTGVPPNDSLLVTGGVLPNYPTAQANFTVQVTATFSNITPGIVYYNQAVVYGLGYLGGKLTDTSTNGSNPDLNDNDKPDDAGEDQPTPFIVQINASSTPCTTLPTVLYSNTFGAGSATPSATLPYSTDSTGYTGVTSTTAMTNNSNDYTIINNPKTADTNFISIGDHTTGTGDMFVVASNALPTVVYQTKVSGLCTNLLYSFNAYVVNVSDTTAETFCNNVGGYEVPNLTFEMVDAASSSSTPLVLSSLNTGNIWNHTWQSYGMRVALPSSSGTIYLRIINNGGGGCGNSFALDDITFGLCNAQPVITVNGVSAGCAGQTTILEADITNGSVFSGGTVVYQWYDSVPGSGVWNAIVGEDSSMLTVPNVNASNAIWYKVNVANQGYLGSSTCSYTSPAFLLQLKSNSSIAATSVTPASATEGCTPTPITLSESGGSLGYGAQWVWYQGGCGQGTSIGTGQSITVEPSTSTAYFVRAEGTCNTTNCVGATVNVVCGLATNLLYFNGTYSSGVANLSWEVTDNENLSGFIVERSTDGVNFNRIDSVTVTGAYGNATYTYNDNLSGVHTETATYRIILVFKTGSTETSSLVAINMPLTLSEGVIVYPNPAANQLTISINSDKQQSMTYTMLSIQGQAVLTGGQALSRGANSVNVNGLQAISDGAYILRIQLQDNVIIKKVIVQK